MIKKLHSQLLKRQVENNLNKLSKDTKCILHSTNSIKSMKSISEKLERKSEINDYLRFTIEVPDISNYVHVCNYYAANLNTFKVTNHWKRYDKSYNGYHIYAKTFTNLPYEVQIHTKRSKKWRDDHRSRLLYDVSKIALDYEYNSIYLMCQFLLYCLTLELQYDLILIHLSFQSFNSFG
jgi:hypothetical protein